MSLPFNPQRKASIAFLLRKSFKAERLKRFSAFGNIWPQSYLPLHTCRFNGEAAVSRRCVTYWCVADRKSDGVLSIFPCLETTIDSILQFDSLEIPWQWHVPFLDRPSLCAKSRWQHCINLTSLHCSVACLLWITTWVLSHCWRIFVLEAFWSILFGLFSCICLSIFKI